MSGDLAARTRFYCQYCAESHSSHHSHRLTAERREYVLRRWPGVGARFVNCKAESDCFVCCALFENGHPAQLKGDAFDNWLKKDEPMRRQEPRELVRVSAARAVERSAHENLTVAPRSSPTPLPAARENVESARKRKRRVESCARVFYRS